MKERQIKVMRQEWEGYNENRYGRPWIARITDWPIGKRPSFTFGKFVGDEGYSGFTEISARDGDVLKYGQKDYRKPENSVNKFAIAEVKEGKFSLRTVMPAEARKQWLKLNETSGE